MSKFLARLLPSHLQWLIKKKGSSKRAYKADFTLEKFEIVPSDQSARQLWFYLSSREREVAALVCMGYKNYEIAELLGVDYVTIQTHLQNIFHKFNVRKRSEIRNLLKSWPAEEWWNYQHQ